jgi:sugar lactone lactonase YvrE
LFFKIGLGRLKIKGKYKIISDTPYLCGEAPMWDGKTNMLFWSDMLSGIIFGYNPKSGIVEKIAEGKNVSGMALRKNGGLVCACHQGAYLWDAKKGFQLIADTHNGDVLRSNDAIADAAGRFLFGTTFYGPELTGYTLGKLFKVERDGSISVLEEGVHLSNGLGFSSDNKIMYYTDTGLRTIYAYDYNLKQGSISNKRVFVKVPDNEGIPDGMTVDAEDFVWSAQWYGSCIVRYDPDGKIDRRLEVPEKQVSSLIFGGEDLTDIYVTTAAKSARLHIAPKGYDFDASGIGGPVYCFNLGIKGKAEYYADIKMKK